MISRMTSSGRTLRHAASRHCNAVAALCLGLGLALVPRSAYAQSPLDGWQVEWPPSAAPDDAATAPRAPAPGEPDPAAVPPPSGIEIVPTPPPAASTTDVPRSPDAAEAASRPSEVRFMALLTDDGQQIDQGLVWRVYQANGPSDEKNKLVGTRLEANPVVKLEPGDYMVNAAFGRAHMTRKIVVKPGQQVTERFVLNAGGLRLNATANGAEAASSVSYSIYADERDQFDNRALVMSGAKPGLVHRLNAGIYQVVSRQGDANAIVQADVTVEAGKLTEVTVTHTGAATTLRLVTRTGGEALPDTQWVIQTAKGETVKESVGALPTHILAPGDYMVIAKSAGRAFKRSFTVRGGEAAQVEVVMP